MVSKQEALTKGKLVIGNSYWCYYMTTSDSRKQIRDWTGVFEVIPIKLEKRGYGNYIEFDIRRDGKYYNIKTSCNIDYRLNQYGCDFYNTIDEAIAAHDAQILLYASNQETSIRKSMCKKLISKVEPVRSQVELRAIEWYEGLEDHEKENVAWLKFYYSEIR